MLFLPNHGNRKLNSRSVKMVPLVHSNDADLKLLTSAAEVAGALAMSFFRKSPNSWAKAGGSLVTEADMAVDTLLRTTLLAARPNYGWLSEETADDLSRRDRDAVFVVDPIDGTRGFMEGDESWCVSLAVVREDRPVAAALNAPSRGEFFTALRGGGAWMGEMRLAVSDQKEMAGARLAGPRGWLKTAAILGSRAELQPHIPALAYRMTSVAAGRLDAAIASARANDWDLAAADLLVHEAGGRLTELDGTVPRYNQEIPRHGVLAASNAILLPALLASTAEAGREVARGRRN
jgi:myo-inositol-1(or 4)-monophosphatase